MNFFLIGDLKKLVSGLYASLFNIEGSEVQCSIFEARQFGTGIRFYHLRGHVTKPNLFITCLTKPPILFHKMGWLPPIQHNCIKNYVDDIYKLYGGVGGTKQELNRFYYLFYIQRISNSVICTVELLKISFLLWFCYTPLLTQANHLSLESLPTEPL